MNVASSAPINHCEIRARACPRCYFCGSEGTLLHTDVVDRYFGAPGSWSFKRCSNTECRLLWLDPMPIEEDLGLAYRHYMTHDEYSAPQSWHRLGGLTELFRRAYRANRYGVEPRPQLSPLLALPLYLTPSRREALDFPLRYIANRPAGRLLD
ncbi:MAG TPA: hypothetical protein VGR40_08370, partial [Candidatus Binatus sp.]|nr:hypothetical protein [Candidatus Binatus sp.]